MSTMRESADVPAWPVYALTVHDDGRVLASGPLIETSGHPTRAAAIEVVAGAAGRLGRSVRATASEPDGAVWPLIVSPDGEVSEVKTGRPRAAAPKKRQEKRAEKRREKDRGRRAAKEGSAAAPRPGAPEGGEAYAEPLAQVTGHLDAGRTEEAQALATQLDTQVAGVLGVSHPVALGVREVRARATAEAGDPVAGIQLYRDVAERWHYRGDAEQAEAVAGRAEKLWTGITDVERALSAGVAVVRMRNQIPGEGGAALASVLAHRERLLRTPVAEAAPEATPVTPTPATAKPVTDAGSTAKGTEAVAGRGAAAGAEVPEPPVAVSSAPRSSRPRPRTAPSWERPAVNARKAG
ncbi:hypothetical protein ACFRK5_35210 [Streptomyces niveus]|uniref:hypothetical protein n=1 Tax=Streptomyces niveus TaxID=193462 RepID=UPI003685DAA8